MADPARIGRSIQAGSGPKPMKREKGRYSEKGRIVRS
jgi:hypothetical protein